jgi:uncharacterized LabA/DUF88 family protein
MRRVVAYIDGMNLYHGLRDKYGRRHHWLNVDSLVRSVLLPGQQLTRVNFFTARVRNQPMSELRQETYLTAITAASPIVEIVEGRFQERSVRCHSCGSVRVTYDEKETDVHIASAIVRDAATDRYETAVLVSADGDLAPAIGTAKWLAPAKRFVAVFPPKRRSDVLRQTCDAALTIGDAKIRAAQLPDKIILPTGVAVDRPAYWR